MLILVCPVCESELQILAKNDKGEQGYQCYNEMCPAYSSIVLLSEITLDCIKSRVR